VRLTADRLWSAGRLSRTARRLAVVMLLSSTCSCSGAPHGERPLAAARQPAAADEVQCQMQRVTGTLLATRVCTSKSQRDALKQSTQDARDFLDRQVIAACPGSPGC
jgi:hypothetical protein